MISIYRDEIRDLLNHNRTQEAEDIWLQLLEDDPLDSELFLAFSHEFEKKGFSKEAGILLNMSIPHLMQEQCIEEAYTIMKRIAQLTPYDEEAHTKIADYFRSIYKKTPNIEKILSVSGINNPAISLQQTMDTILNLTAFSPGDFCKHKSWGMGKIVDIDYDSQILLIDFYAKKNHKMDATLAVTALEKIPDHHISALKYKNMNKLKELAEDDPIELIKIVLRSFDDNKATLQEISDSLSPDIIDIKDWKKWWDKTKNQLKTSLYIVSPERKQHSYQLFDKPVSLDDKLLKKYAKLSTVEEKLSFISTQLKKQPKDMFSDPVLEIFSNDLGKFISDTAESDPSIAFEAYYTLVSMSQLMPNALDKSPIRNKELFEKAKNISVPICSMSKMEYQKQALNDIKNCFPDQWTEMYLVLLKDIPFELIDDIIDDLMKAPENLEEIQKVLQFAYDFIGDAEDLVLWTAKNIGNPAQKDLIKQFSNIVLLEKLIDLLDLHNSGVINSSDRIVNKLDDLIRKNNFHFVTQLLKLSTTDQKIRVAQTIMNCSSLDKTTKQSLLAKFIIDSPDVKQLMKSESTQSAAIYSSEKMFEKKQAELYHISNVLIPQNARDIGTARAHGDLRENFEFKAAKEEQTRLLRLKEELEDMLSKTRIIDYSKANDKQVSLATKVVLNDLLNNRTVTYSILGIWDSEPENGVISYLTPLAKELIGKKVGDEVEFSIGNENHHHIIAEIIPITAEP